ncbi:VOC family protein [Raineyella sp.]|uniref:PhnB-like domain-containing protein n=1 Tax=bioreactor metagenome TaxID=1076179 RepID=A0A644ZT30_9ZZZZ|nr:VOC family protein [Raineyella sp.]MEA5155895.1 VOC family protein [Raineyella sp.]
MTLPTPYLSFRGQAREAMEFYRSVFGGDLTISTFGDFGYEGMPADAVMHSTLTAGGFEVMASDTPDSVPFQAGSQISLSLAGTKAEEEKLRGWFGKLADGGGTVTMPLEKQVWGDVYGAVTDRFGLNWMVDIGQA